MKIFGKLLKAAAKLFSIVLMAVILCSLQALFLGNMSFLPCLVTPVCRFFQAVWNLRSRQEI